MHIIDWKTFASIPKSRLIFVFALFSSLLLTAIILSAGSVAQAESLNQAAQNGQVLFEQKCKACHTIGGGRLVGPDLQGVTQRQDIAWIKQFISAPDKMINAKDPTAMQLFNEYKMVMPNLGLDAAQVDALVAYLENPGAAGATAGAAQVVAVGDPVRGEQIFTGSQALNGGGTPCISCHSVSGVGALGGGNLGPNLTHAVQRYGGQAGMASTLAGLPFPTMQGIFTTRPLSPAEQADLLAFFLKADQQPVVPLQQPISWPIWGFGALGLLLLFGILFLYWPRQRRSVSDQLRSAR